MSVYSNESRIYLDGISTARNDIITFDKLGITTLELPDPLIDWLPYKWKKYLPTWHLVRSYRC